MKPLAIDLFCGLGGWTEGLIAEGYRVVGFDNERHVYGEASYPAKAPSGTQWFNDGPRTPDSLASMGGKSSARKAASAHIAKIPFELARHIARAWHP